MKLLKENFPRQKNLSGEIFKVATIQGLRFALAYTQALFE
jgi:hypothetical protein